MKTHFNAAPASPRIGPRMDVRYMTRSQLFKSASQISIVALVVCVAGFLTAYLVDAIRAGNTDTLADLLALSSTVLGGLGVVVSGYLVARGLTRSNGYSPVSVWQADLEREAGRVRSGMQLQGLKVESIRRRGRDLVIHLEARVHQSTGVPGRNAGTVWIYPAEMWIRSGRVLQPAPRAPMQVAAGGLGVGSQRLGEMMPVPLDFDGLVRFEGEIVGEELLVIEGRGIEIRLVGEGRYIEIFEP